MAKNLDFFNVTAGGACSATNFKGLMAYESY
jgi:hypothetical protein